MPVPAGTERRRGVVEELVADFAGVLPAPVVAAAVRDARRELHGQVPDGAMDELVHRLAGHRLRHRG